jgi:tetratricopeptide (TPR) repeat protein
VCAAGGLLYDEGVIGTLLAQRYRIEAELGRGGMGTVFRAHDTLLDRPVALKLLNAPGLGSKGPARLLEEARAAARLNHPHIVSIYDAGDVDGLAYIVMELVEGVTLFGHAPSDLAAIVAIARQLCAALDDAHRQGILHRDLKPENVLLTRDGTVKLSDFGLARSLASRLTSEGVVIGTVFYMAPESILGQPLDGRADLYALGVMLYELTTGKLPFDGDDPVAVLSQHLYVSPMPPRAHRAEIPPALDHLIQRLLQKNPADRPETAAVVAQLLEHWEAGPLPDSAATLSVLDRIVRGRIVGRERELAEASALWRRALASEGQVLAITGEPGIGKTRLVRELTALAEITGAVVLRGECYAEGGAPYAPLAQMWRQLAEAGRLALEGQPAGPTTIELPPGVRADLQRIIPGLPTEGATNQRPLLDAQAEQQRQFEAGVRLIHALTATAPVLIVLEDGHWADSGTLFALRHIARRSTQRRLMIVITYREVELNETCCLPDVIHDLNRERLLKRIKLTRLSRSQVHTLLAVMFGMSEAEISDALLDGLYRETEGNPFFLEEVCKALIEDGQLFFADGRWQRAQHVELHIPQSVRVTIGARLSKLAEPAQQALRVAAILGREFDFDTLQSAAELSEPVLIEALESATQAQLVNETGNGHGLTYTFAHALIPSTLRESMSGPRLRLLHRRAAAAIERRRPGDFEALAYHASQAGDDPRARDYFKRAADRALGVFANQEAERHYRAALDLGHLEGAMTAAERAPLEAGLGEALFRQSRYAEACERWRQAGNYFLVAGAPDHAAHALARQARATWYRGDPAEALAVCVAGLARIPREPAGPGLAALLHETGRAYFFNAESQRNPPPEAQAFCEQALRMAEQFDLVEIQAESLTTLALTRGQGTSEAIDLLRRAIELSEPAGLYAAASRAYYNLSGALAEHEGRFDSGVAAMRRAAELSRRTGQTVMAVDMLLNALEGQLTVGDFAAVERDLADLEPEVRSLPNVEPLGLYAKILKAELLVYRGEWEQAAVLLDEVEAHPEREGDKLVHQYWQRALIARATLAMETGDLQAGIASLGVLLGNSFYRLDHDEVGPLCTQSILLSRAGDPDAAAQALEEARRIAGDPPKFVAPLQLHWAAGELAFVRGDPGQALSHFEAGAAGAAALGAPWYTASLRERAASAALARGHAGDPALAADHLRQAAEAFERLGAGRYAERARAALTALSDQSPSMT